MNRAQAFAIALLAATWPAVARAQTLGEVLDMHAKLSTRPRPQGLGDLNVYANSLTGSHIGDWSAYNRAGWRALDKGYYDTAEHEFLAAIKAAKREGLDDPRLVARSYADFAWALQKQGRNAEAEPLLKWVLIAREGTLGRESLPVFQTLNQLATLYSDLGRYSEAEALLGRVIEAQAKSPKADLREHARSQSLMGLLLAAQRRYAESESYFRNALALREKAPTPAAPEIADALTNLAWTYHIQGKDDLARPLFERALKLIERTKGESDYAVAHVVDGLGQILASQGKPADAEADFVRAIGIWEQFPDEELSLLEVFRHYADLLEEQGRLDDLKKVRARMAPLRAKYSFSEGRIGPWYRFPDPSSGNLKTQPLTAPRIPG